MEYAVVPNDEDKNDKITTDNDNILASDIVLDWGKWESSQITKTDMGVKSNSPRSKELEEWNDTIEI